MAETNLKRIEQLREAWIKNVMRIKNLTRIEAEQAYEKIKPYTTDKQDKP